MPGKSRLSREEKRRLDRLGLELRLIRDSQAELEFMSGDLKDPIKELMKKGQILNYDGERVRIVLKTNEQTEVDTEVAYRTVPLEELLPMLRVDKKRFEAYVRENNIDISPEEYLRKTGSYVTILTTPKVALSRVRTTVSKLYNAVMQGAAKRKTK
jgi:hypothetical protein